MTAPRTTAGAGSYNRPFTPTGGASTTLQDVLDKADNAIQPVSPLTATGLSTPHILADWLKYPVSLERFGCVGNFNGATGTDNTVAFNKAVDSQEALILQPLRYLISTPIDFTNRSVSISGSYGSSALVFASGASRGIKIAPSQFDQGVNIENIIFLTLGQENGAALRIEYNDADANLNQNFRRVALRGLQFRGVNEYTQGWDIGLSSKNMWFYDIQDVMFTGRHIAGSQAPSQTTFATAGYYQEVGGGGGIGGGYTRGVRSLYCKSGLEFKASTSSYEGVNIMQVDVVTALNGVKADFTGASAGFVVYGGHLNVFEKGLWLKHCEQAVIDGLLIYKHPGAVSETVGMQLDYCDFAEVSKVICMNQASNIDTQGGWVGVRLNNTNYSNISMSQERSSKAVDFISSTNNDICVKVNGTFGPAPVLTDEPWFNDNNNRVRNLASKRYAVKNTTNITTTSGGTFSVSQSVQVLKGEAYRIDIHISHTNGATAGDVLATLVKIGGAATVAFDKDRTAISTRRQQLASANGTFDLSVIMTVADSGDVNLGALVQSTGSNGSIAIGDAQMTITPV